MSVNVTEPPSVDPLTHSAKAMQTNRDETNPNSSPPFRAPKRKILISPQTISQLTRTTRTKSPKAQQNTVTNKKKKLNRKNGAVSNSTLNFLRKRTRVCLFATPEQKRLLHANPNLDPIEIGCVFRSLKGTKPANRQRPVQICARCNNGSFEFVTQCSKCLAVLSESVSLTSP